MEIVLEHDEIEALLREALAARRVKVPEEASFRVRSNHKKGTIRAVFKSKSERREE
jgi:hypothetical protein